MKRLVRTQWQQSQEDPVEYTIEDVIAQYEDILTPEAEKSIIDQERGNREQEYLQNNHRSAEENIIQIPSQARREQTSHPLNAAAGVIAYNFLEDEAPERIEEETGLRPENEWQEDCLQYWAELDGAEEVLPETGRNSSYEAISGFENLRNLFAHNIETYSGLPNQALDDLPTSIFIYYLSTVKKNIQNMRMFVA